MNDLLTSGLQGFGPLLAEGTWMTVKLALLALALSLLLGLIGACAKLALSPAAHPRHPLHHLDPQRA